jgi:hypothetical protein
MDFERQSIHIRQSKYKKDRIVPLSAYMAMGLKKYIEVEHPHIWLFNGKELDGWYSVRGLSWLMREALKRTSVKKDVNLHSLRHSYATQRMTLPVKHYHIVFTVPHELNAISMLDSRWFYNLLLSVAWDILRTFEYTHYGVESGAVMLLQTWGENLSLHPHVHCIVPAAGQSLAGNMKHIGREGKYLYPVTQLSVAFR